MIRRTLFRLIRVTVALVGVMVASLCVAGYLAVSEPGYYVRLRDDRPTPAEVEAVETSLEQEREAYVSWLSRVEAAQRRVPDDAAQRAAEPGPVPVPPPHEVRFTSRQLNTLIAAETKGLAGGALENPRVRVTTDRIDLACGLQTPAARCVVSAGFKPSLTREGVLVLELESAQVGRLPIPCQAMLSLLPRKRERLSGNLYLDLSGPKPRVTLDLTDRAKKLMAESIECGAGEVTVRFVARPAE